MGHGSLELQNGLFWGLLLRFSNHAVDRSSWASVATIELKQNDTIVFQERDSPLQLK